MKKMSSSWNSNLKTFFIKTVIIQCLKCWKLSFTEFKSCVLQKCVPSLDKLAFSVTNSSALYLT